MLGLTDLIKDSRFYQETRAEALEEGLEEGRKEGRKEGAERERTLVLRQLRRKLGELPGKTHGLVSQLPLEILELLGEALLDFSKMEDLEAWLAQQPATEQE